MEELSPREQAKAERRSALLAAAARLFAARGFDGVSLEELGAAAGVSGPAVYRHFASKQAVLAALLVGVSERLFDGGSEVAASANADEERLRRLVAFHVDFALANPEVIRVQDRDLDSLPEAERHQVRALQRRYVELWVGVLAGLKPDAEARELRTRCHATFGLINSTPHSARPLPSAALGELLSTMAWAALMAPPDAVGVTLQDGHAVEVGGSPARGESAR